MSHAVLYMYVISQPASCMQASLLDGYQSNLAYHRTYKVQPRAQPSITLSAACYMFPVLATGTALPLIIAWFGDMLLQEQAPWSWVSLDSQRAGWVLYLVYVPAGASVAAPAPAPAPAGRAGVLFAERCHETECTEFAARIFLIFWGPAFRKTNHGRHGRCGSGRSRAAWEACSLGLLQSRGEHGMSTDIWYVCIP